MTGLIQSLFKELGREDTDSITLCYFGATQEFTSIPVQVSRADVLASVLTKQKCNVYISVNPTDPEMVLKGRGTAAAVTRLSAVWADLDIKTGGVASTEAAQRVINSLSAIINSNPVAVVHSGNGLQPYWAVEDGEISDANRNFMAGVLKRWGLLVERLAQIEGGKVDNVFDLPRVLRAPGSVNFKSTPKPVTIEFNEWSHPVTVREIVEAVEGFGFLNDNVTVDEFVVLSPPSGWEPAEVDCAWAERLIKEIDQAEPGDRHPWLLGKATKINVAARNGCITDETYVSLIQLLEAKFLDLLATQNPPRKAAPGEVATALKWAQTRVSTFADVRMADNLDYHAHRGEVTAANLPKESSSSSEPATPAPSDNEPLTVRPVALGDENFHYTDAANAERLAESAEGNYIFVPGIGWYLWSGGRYVRDETNSIVRLAIGTVRTFADDHPSKQAIEWAKKSMSASAIASSVRLAESIPEMVTLPYHLDANAIELCTPAGIVNLETSQLRDAYQGRDLNTRQTRFSPRAGNAPRWQAFLKTILEDEDRIEYMQELLGVALVGEVRWQILPIFAGGGANGKSTLLDIAGGVLGDYCAVMPENFLLESSKMEHSTEIFRLRGIRMAIASETRPDGKFNESRVKMLTGERTLSARGMRQDFVDFIATHTLFVALNHPPSVKSGGDGFWRRIRKVDFRYQVPKHLRDPNLAQTILDEEGPEVLHWMIEGARRVIEKGLSEPTSVEVATLQYRDEEDHIHAFVSDMISVAPEAQFTTIEIYSTYASWCKRSGENPLNQVALMRELQNRYPLVPVRTNRSRGWKGLMVHYDREDSRDMPRMSSGFPRRVRPDVDDDDRDERDPDRIW